MELFVLIKYEWLQHRNKHESISNRKQQIGFFCYGFKSVFTGTGGLSARDVPERWSVDELDGRLWCSALCSHTLVIGDLLQSGILWSCKGLRRNQSLITALFSSACPHMPTTLGEALVLQNIF